MYKLQFKQTNISDNKTGKIVGINSGKGITKEIRISETLLLCC